MKRITIITLSLVVFMLTSCDDWLNVSPKGTVESDDLLSTAQGYNAALAGVYTMLISENLYGKNLTYAVMDNLAQYWGLRNNTYNIYFPFTRYDYKHAAVVSEINSIWKELYDAIANANNIIASIDRNRDQIKYSELIEGEAYALRGFIHFQLLKYYGPVIRSDADKAKAAIPYREKFNVDVLRFSTFAETVDLIRRDLNRALELLGDDPIKQLGRTGNGNNSFLDYHNVIDRRGSRMNYYAVLSTLCQLEQWAGNKEKAYELADRIIKECEANKIDGQPVFMIHPKELFNMNSDVMRDIVCSTEMVFSLYMNNLFITTNKVFGFETEDQTPTEKDQIAINTNQYANFLTFVYGRKPDGAGTDYRLVYWFSKKERITNYYNFNKLKKPDKGVSMPPPWLPEMGIIKLSDIYYIACETLIGIDNDRALGYLNAVREQRGLPLLEKGIDDENMMTYLTREMRKELIGEGKMFAFYKRTFRPIEENPSSTIVPEEKNFVFPIPDDEYEFSDNVKPE